MGTRKKVRETPNQREYRKQVSRIKANITYLKNHGFTVPDINLPEKPKVIRKRDIQKLKDITRANIAAQSTYVNPNVGVPVTGQKAYESFKLYTRDKLAYKKKLKDDARKKKEKIESRFKAVKIDDTPTYEDIILNNVYDIIDDWSPSPNWSNYWASEKGKQRNQVKRILDNAISKEGRKAVALRLQARALDIFNIVNTIIYGSSQEVVEFALTEFASILSGEILTLEQTLELDDLEFEEM